MKNEELQRVEKHHPLGTSPLLPWTVPLLLSLRCTLNPSPVFVGRRQLPLPLLSKQAVAYVESDQSRVSLESFKSMTNMPWHKPTDSISAVAMTKMFISNRWPRPWCGRGSRARWLKKESSTCSPTLISLIIDYARMPTYNAVRANSP